ncbi:hypothetical protein CKO44_19295 [Rubrivivax gelatinosus]|uniref:AraC family transcriptional regulator n=1 Tax=Rubrivivax gelatinosus TaxID=28068 RepID=UPI001906A723|nr:AraC family transcriptional regulator [Rubrivivax gelatinosus]MBK1615611.1 hypothetical protein [Rubrivivax gelatinosus]
MNTDRRAQSSLGPPGAAVDRSGCDPHATGPPPLAFGDAGAEVDDDAAAWGGRMAGVLGALQSCEPLGPAATFRQKSSTITINGLTMAALAGTPLRFELAASTDLTLLIPFAGEGTFDVGGVVHSWQAEARGLFVAGAAGSGACSLHSVLVVRLQPAQLQAAARSLLGMEPGSKSDFWLGPTRTVDLQAGGMAFGEVFRHLCAVIDAYRGAVDVLEAVGLDEQFYRHIVMLLRPGLTLEAALRKPAQASRRVLDPVCGYIMAHLHAPMTLTDLEGASGVSRRSLQYLFWQRHACSPMQWVRGQRLEKVRSMLMHAESRESVTSAALQSGFSNLGAFSAYYRERFGEQPSETLRRSGARDA